MNDKDKEQLARWQEEAKQEAGGDSRRSTVLYLEKIEKGWGIDLGEDKENLTALEFMVALAESREKRSENPADRVWRE